LLPRWMTWCG